MLLFNTLSNLLTLVGRLSLDGRLSLSEDLVLDIRGEEMLLCGLILFVSSLISGGLMRIIKLQKKQNSVRHILFN